MKAKSALLAVPALAAALAAPAVAAVAAEEPAKAAHMVRGPDDTRLLKPAAVASRVDFVVRAGRRPVSGYVRILSVHGTRQYESAPFRLKPGRVFRDPGSVVKAPKVRVIYDVGRPGDRTRVTYVVSRPATP